MSIYALSVYVDKASNTRASRIGIVLQSPKGIKLEHSLRLNFQTSNNEAKYEALMVELRATAKVEATDVEIHSNSHLVVS